MHDGCGGTFDSALQRQEDDHKLKASLGYRINPHVKTKTDKSTNQPSPRASAVRLRVMELHLISWEHTQL